MLEVFAVIGLCRLNRKNAIARGRRPGGYIALTIILWILFEFVGAIFGILLFGRDNDTFTVMFVALPCAALGGLISFLIAKFGPRGDYVDPSVQPVNFYTNNNGMPMYGTGAQYNPQQVPVQPSPMQPNASPFAPAAGQPVQPSPFAPAPGQSVQQSPFAPAPGAAASGIRYCMNCGAPNNSTSKFCESCGQSIG